MVGKIFAAPVMLKLEQGMVLRELHHRDAEELYALVDKNRLHLREWLTWVDQQQGVADSMKFIERVVQARGRGDDLVLAIECAGRMVGVLSLNEISHEHQQGVMGFWLCATMQGQGIMTRAVREMLKFAFEGMGLHRVMVRVADGNLKSRRVVSKVGFIQEGVARGAIRIYDRYVDHVIYSVLDSDPCMQEPEHQQ